MRLTYYMMLRYIASRIYLHNPPGEDNALRVARDAPEEIQHEEHHLKFCRPEVNVWCCIVLLAVVITVMAVTAEMVSPRLHLVSIRAD
jgi:Ca2+:H+ antiporter